MTKANGDIQAVILVGPGDRLYPLVDEASPTNSSISNSGSNAGLPSAQPCSGQSTSGSSSNTSNYSKALLPICNRPMLYYPLTWLIQSGVSEIYIVVHQKLFSKLSGYLHKQYEFTEGNKIEVVPVSENNGSLSALMAIRHRLKGDFVVVGCDLVTDAPLSRMTDLHRSKGSLLTCMFSGPQASGLISSSINGSASAVNDSTLTDPRYLASLAGEELLVALDMSSMKSSPAGNMFTCDLILSVPQADSLDETNSYLPVKMSTLCRYPRMRLRTDLLDPHCYLFSLDIFRVIEEMIIGSKGSSSDTDDLAQEKTELVVPASLFSIREDLIPKVLRRVHRFHNHEGVSTRPSSTFAFVVDSGHYCLRANTIPALLESTRQLMKSSNVPSSVRVASSAEISPRSQVGTDSMFGENSRLGERSSIKKSVIGSGCCIGSNVKIVNCLVMDNVVIEDGCKLEGCVVGPRVILREKCLLKDCDIAGGFCVEKETSAKGESFGSNRELVENLY